MELEDIPDDKGRSILYKTFSETVVLGWKGMVDREGKKMEFTAQNCNDVFHALPDFYDRLRTRLMDHQLFLLDVEEASIKK